MKPVTVTLPFTCSIVFCLPCYLQAAYSLQHVTILNILMEAEFYYVLEAGFRINIFWIPAYAGMTELGTLMKI